MKKSLKDLNDLHFKHKITHKVLSLVLFSILTILAVHGLSRVGASQHEYTEVPNGNVGVCYKIGENFNDPANHVSCKTYKPICQTSLGSLVECDTGIKIN